MPMGRDMIFTWQKSVPILRAFLFVLLSISVAAHDDKDKDKDGGLSSLTSGSPWFTADGGKGPKLPKLPKMPDLGDIFGPKDGDAEKQPGNDESPEKPEKQPGSAKSPEKPEKQPGSAKSPEKPEKQPGSAESPEKQPGNAESPEKQPGNAETREKQPVNNPNVGPDGKPITGPGKPRYESNSLGKWRITTPNVGVSAMQLQTMPFDKVVWFDTTFLGPSALELTPPGNCPLNFETNQPDCYVHCIEYDGLKDTTRPLTIKSDPWCSTGSLSGSGTLIGTGGYYKGRATVRLLKPGPDSDFTEKPEVLASERWYASQHLLEDGNLIVIGGRKSFNYEIIPPDTLDFPQKKTDFPFLQQTTDPVENNLYPFLYLTPDGNLFLFANNRSVIFDHKTGKIIKELPQLPGGSRNYPASGMSAVLPIRINPTTPEVVSFDIMVCGGASPHAFWPVDSATIRPKPKHVFWPALQDCNKIRIMDPNPHWEKDMLLSPRVMGDMLILPTGDLLILNGAKKGTSGWWNGDDPNMTPEIYNPRAKLGGRFKQLAPTNIPRMYHAASAVLSNGEVVVAGSNENDRYVFEGVPFPTELRVEKFSPPYLDESLNQYKPKISGAPEKLTIAAPFSFTYAFDAEPKEPVDASDLKVHLLFPPFTTHGYSQQQRMIILEVQLQGDQVQAVAPPNPRIAPAGYYMMFLVYRGVPSLGAWVRLFAQ